MMKKAWSLLLTVTMTAAAMAQPAEPRKEAPALGTFPVTMQFSPVPDGPGWRGGDQPLDETLIGQTLDNAIAHGFTALYAPPETACKPPLPAPLRQAVLDAAKARGMKVTYQTGGLECFGRLKPPEISVFSPQYGGAVRQEVERKLAPVKALTGVERVFCFQDEPFHQGVGSLGLSDELKAEFRKRHGYDMPATLEESRKDPKVWLDVVNFHSDSFPAGWRQTYQAIKAVDPTFKAILTHDSHSTFGGASGSDASIFVDDVFHWGGDFADTFVYDIYPYMMTDFRYGECGRWPRPRMSQFHYSFAQMRNLTRTYGKELGFWFGTYNDAWFETFMKPERQATSWAERETATTAVAQGADFLISGLGIPQDAAHWDELGKGLRLIQQAGPELRQAPKVKARACFLFPRTQCVQLQEEYWNVGLSFELFLRAFGELDVLHEEQVKDDTLDGYQVLCLFDVKLLPRETAERIARFVERGGVVIADCVPSMGRLKEPLDVMNRLFGVEEASTGRIARAGIWLDRNEAAGGARYTRPLAGPETATTATLSGQALGRRFALTVASPRPCRITTGEALLKSEAGQPWLVRRKVGQGSAWLLGFCAQDSYFQAWKTDDEPSRAQLAALLGAITDSVGVRAHVYSSNPDIEAAVRANDRGGFLFVIDHEAPAKTTRIRLRDLPFQIGGITDVESGKTVDYREEDGAIVLDADLSGGVTRILRLSPAQAS